MMGESAKINWEDMSQALPAFLTAILMPLTYSITTGNSSGKEKNMKLLVAYLIQVMAFSKRGSLLYFQLSPIHTCTL